MVPAMNIQDSLTLDILKMKPRRRYDNKRDQERNDDVITIEMEYNPTTTRQALTNPKATATLYPLGRIDYS
jgi:hypothetical protein